MKRIGDIVFFGCSSLGEVEYNAIEVEDQSKRIFPESIWSITFGDKVRVIPAYLLDGCYGLDAINLPESLEVIGEHAFSGCGGIKELVIPDKVEKIGGLAIYQMENLETLTIGEGLKDLNNASFCTGCTKLTHITWNAIKLNDVPVRCMAPVETAIFGDKVEFVPGHLFWGDGALKDVTIGKSVKKIGEATFRECSITKIDLPETLEEVGDYAFYRSCIENIFIPENVVSFGAWALGTPTLKTVIFTPAVAPKNWATLRDHSEEIILYVPNMDEYRSSQWSQYSKYMRPMIVADKKEEFYYDGTTPEVTFTSNIPGYELASLSEIMLDGSAGKHSIPATASFVGEKNFTIDLAYIYTVNKGRQEIIWEQAFEGLGVGHIRT